MCTGACEAGFYCPAGSISSRQEECGDANKYCSTGSATPRTVSSGYYSTPESAPVARRTGQQQCPSHQICKNGIRYDRLQWSSGCSRTADTGSIVIDERQSYGANLGIRAAAVSNMAPAQTISYRLVSEAPTAKYAASCGSKTPFRIDAATGTWYVDSPTMLDRETCTEYAVVVEARDAGGTTRQCSLVVELGDVNDPPLFTESPGPVQRSIEEGARIEDLVGSPIVATDEDAGQELFYELVVGQGDVGLGFFDIGGCSGQIKVAKAGLDFETKSSYSFTVRVTDDGKNPSPLSATISVIVSILDVNEPPFFNASQYNMKAEENCVNGANMVSIETRVVAIDLDGDTLSYSMSRNDRNAFGVNAATGEIVVSDCSQLNYEIGGMRSFSIEVTATDPQGGTIATQVAVSVVDTNDRPAITGRQIFKVNENAAIGSALTDSATLANAVVSATDEDVGHASQLTWSIISSAPASTSGLFQINPATGALTVGQAIDFEAVGNVSIITVKAEDPGIAATAGFQAYPALSHTETIRVTIGNVNEAPTAPSPQVWSVAEDVAQGTIVPSPTFAFDDPDNNGAFSVKQSHTLSVTTATPAIGSSMFRFSGQEHGDVRLVVNSPLDFETHPSYNLTVLVSDNGDPVLSAPPVTVTVTVIDVNEPPSIVGNQVFELDENSPAGTAVGTVQYSDPDAGDSVTFVIASATNNGTQFYAIDPSTGAITVKTGSFVLDYENSATSSSRLTVVVTDAGGLSANDTVVIRLRDVNEAPTALPQSFNVAELTTVGYRLSPPFEGSDVDDPAGTGLTYSITAGNAGGYFAIESTTGTITVAKQLPAFSTQVWALTILVTDEGGLTGSSTATITLVDTNRPPVFASLRASVPENTPRGAPQATVISDFGATDGDDGTQGLEYLIKMVTPAGMRGTFAIEGSSLIVIGGGLDHEVVPEVQLLIVVTDVPGGSLIPLSAQAWVNISVTDVPEPPMVFADDTVVLENATAGTLVGSVTVYDQDVGSTLIASMQDLANGQAPACFAIDGTSGVITVTSNGCLDFESTPSYSLLVIVTDDTGLTGNTTLTVGVANVNEPPIVTSDGTVFTVSESDGLGKVVATLEGTDPDFGSFLTWKIAPPGASNADNLFELSTSGLLTLRSQPDHENRRTVTLDITLTDSISGIGSVTTVRGTVIVSITNEADAVLTDVALGGAIPTAGSSSNVLFSGRDFGPTQTRLARTGEPPAAVAAFMARPATQEEVTAGSPTMSTAADGSMQVRVDLDSNACSVSQPNDEISCTVPAGTGTGFHWNISVTDTHGTTERIGSTTDAMRTAYAPPQVSGADDSAQPTVGYATAGGETLRVTGSNLGPIGGSPATINPVRVFYKATAGADVNAASGQDVIYEARSCAVTIADNIIECQTVGGIGTAWAFRVLVGGQLSGWTTTTLRFASPMLGGVIVEPSQEGLRSLAMLLDPDTASPAAASVTAARNASLMTTMGGEVAVLRGSNFGRQGLLVNAFYGPDSSPQRYTATQCAVTVANVEIRCRTVPGVGTAMTWTVEVGKQQSAPAPRVAGGSGEAEPSLVVSYLPPLLVSVSGGGSKNGNTEGGQTLQLVVREAGPAGGSAAGGADIQVRYGGADASRYGGVACFVADASVSVHCLTAPGTGKGHAIEIEVAGQTSNRLLKQISYHPPVITYFPSSLPDGRSAPAAAAALTSGGQLVVIQGRNFGTRNMETLEAVTYFESSEAQPEATSITTKQQVFQAVACNVSMTEPHRAIECLTTQGAGSQLRWTVRVDGQDSVTPTTSYGPPEVHGVILAGTNVPATALSTSGGQRVTLKGRNFGPPRTVYNRRFLGTVTYGPASGAEYVATGCIVRSHEHVDCTTSPGTGAALKWIVEVQGQSSVDAPALSAAVAASMPPAAYARPVIVEVTPNGFNDSLLLSTVGGAVVHIRGHNFGLEDPLARADILYGGVLLSRSFYGREEREFALPISPGNPVAAPGNLPADRIVDASQGGWVEAELQAAAGESGLVGASTGRLPQPSELPVAFTNTSTDSLTGVRTRITTTFNRLPSGSACAVGPCFLRVITAHELGQQLQFTLPAGQGGDQVLRVSAGRGAPSSDTTASAAASGRQWSSESMMAYNAPRVDRVVTSRGSTPAVLVLTIEGEDLGPAPAVHIAVPQTASLFPGGSVTSSSAFVETVAGGAESLSNDAASMLECDAVSEDHGSIVCRFTFGLTPRMQGTVFVTDDTSPMPRVSRPAQFANIAPSISAAQAAELSGKALFRANGSYILSLEGESFGVRTQVSVDGRLCTPVPGDSVVSAEGSSSSSPFLSQELVSTLPTGIDLKRVRCMVPPGWGASRAVVVWNDNQPSSSLVVGYSVPVVRTVRAVANVPRESAGATEARLVSGGVATVGAVRVRSAATAARGTAPSVGSGTVLEIVGDDFGDWLQLDNVCRNASYLMRTGECPLSRGCSYGPDIEAPGAPSVCHATCRTEMCRIRLADGISTLNGRSSDVLQGLRDYPLGRVSLVKQVPGSSPARLFLAVLTWSNTRVTAEMPQGVGSGWRLVLERGLPAGEIAEYGLDAEQPGGETVYSHRLPAASTPGTPEHTAAIEVGFLPPVVSSVDVLLPPASAGGDARDTGSNEAPTLPAEGSLLRVTGDGFGDPGMASSSLPADRRNAVFPQPVVDLCDADRPSMPCHPLQLVQYSHEQLTVQLVPGVGRRRWVRVRVAEQVSAAPSTAQLIDTPASPASAVGPVFRYHKPSVTSVSVNALPTGPMGGMPAINITITGSSFATPAIIAALDAFPPSDAALASGTAVRSNAMQVQVLGRDPADPNSRSATVLEWTHNRIVAVAPEGEGLENALFATVAGLVSNSVPIAYEAPRITAVLDGDGRPLGMESDCCPTLGGFEITIVGRSLGMRRFNPASTSLGPAAQALSVNYPWLSRRRVLFSRLTQNSSTDLDDTSRFPKEWAECAETPADGGLTAPDWQHEEIKCVVPDGVGANLAISVFTGFGSGKVQMSNLVAYSYSKPVVQFMTPFPSNARGETVRLFGVNLADRTGQIAAGPGIPASLVRVGNLECSALRDEPVSATGTSVGRALVCETQDDVVGRKNVSLTVAAQTTFLDAEPSINLAQLGTTFAFTSTCEESAVVRAVYQREYDAAAAQGMTEVTARARGLTAAVAEETGDYGRDGELCVACPRGAYCEGSVADPVALGTWWMTNVSARDAQAPAECSSRRLASLGQSCFRPVRCEPQIACDGLNSCSLGYAGFRCQQCSAGFYRLDGFCERCPDTPWLMFVLLGAAAIVACFAAALMNSRNVNIAFIAIGMDYFQVVAIFSRARVDWPDMLRFIFRIMSAFNLNLELTAPECLIPDFGYQLKWFATMALPVAAALVFSLVFVAKVAWKWARCTNNTGRFKGSIWSHADGFVSMMVTGMYVMYLVLARTTLDVFNCSPVLPPDGNEYLSGMTDVVCWEDPMHQLLIPFAVIGAGIYLVGYPAFAFYHVRRNADMVCTDQLLRARGVSIRDSRFPEDVARFRKRWQRLYYMFKPDTATMPWICMLLLRKALVAAAALLFRSTPSYLMAMVLLVLFAAYVSHVRRQPYMAPGDFQAVGGDHAERVRGTIALAAEKGKPVDWTKHMHMRIERRIADHSSKKRLGLRDKTSSADKWDAVASETPRTAKARLSILRGAFMAYYLVDYNAVEAILLACGILVNLSGLMFLSGRFADPDLRGYYQAEYDGLAFSVIAIVLLSVAYFLCVFFLEILVLTNPAAAGRCCAFVGICLRPCLTGVRDRAKKRLGRKDAASSSADDAAALVSAGHAEVETESGAGEFELRTNAAMGKHGSSADDAGIHAKDLPQAPPGDMAWMAIRERFVELERYQRETTAKSKADRAATRGQLGSSGHIVGQVAAMRGTTGAGVFMSNPLAARGDKRRSFGAVSSSSSRSKGKIRRVFAGPGTADLPQDSSGLVDTGRGLPVGVAATQGTMKA